MENVPVSVRFSRTMDVLMKFNKVPPILRQLAMEAISNLLIRSLWKNQVRSEASPTSPASVYILSSIEESLRHWICVLPGRIREEVLMNTSKMLVSDLGSVGYRSQHRPYNPLPVMIASCFEILFDAHFKTLEIFNELQWNKESRGKVLHLLHKNLNSGLQSIEFSCYKSPHYGLTSVPFSEKFILASCFNRLPNLRSLHLPNTCDDDILAKIAECCPLLEDLNVNGSFGITNMGIQWFCQGTYNPNHLYHNTHQLCSTKNLPDNRKFMLEDPSRRVGFVPTPLVNFGQTISKTTMKKGQILKSLRKANFSGCSIDSKGLEGLLTSCKSLERLVVDDEVWTAFFSLFEANEDKGGVTNGCIDCVGPITSMVDINMVSNVTTFMDSILFLFPNLSHLILSKPLSQANPDILANLALNLSEFSNQNSLTLKEVHFDHISPFLTSLGESLTSLSFGGKSTSINIDHLSRTCPNLTNLVIVHSSLTMDDNKVNGFNQLRYCKLWDIHLEHAQQHSWKKLVKSSKNLEKLYLWNIIITDEDLEDILKINGLKRMEEIRIGCSEIAFVKLTEDSVTRLVKSCPELKCIGGICDWKTRDLLSLLQTLMVEGGWKITLEAQN